MKVETPNKNSRKRCRPGGFTLLQMLIVVLVIGVIGAFAAYGIVQARQRVRLTNSARLLASYLEKARVDSVRRHAMTNADMASVTFTSASSYRVRYDMDGNGTLDTRDVNLENGIVVVGNPVPTRFDWRGRFMTDNATITRISITLQYGTRADDQRTIDVTRSGDVTIDSREYLDDVPNVNVNSNLSPTDSGSTVNGNSNPHPSPSPTPDEDPTLGPPPPPDQDPTPYPTPQPSPIPTPSPSPQPSPTPTPSPSPSPSPQPTPSPSPAACSVTTLPSPLTIHKNGGSDTLIFTVIGGSGSVSFVSGPANLEVTGISNFNFTVTSLNNSRGDFDLYFNTPCGQRVVVATVIN